MNFPCLVLKQFCKTHADIKLDAEGLNVYGEPLEGASWSGNVNWQSGAKWGWNDTQKQLIMLSGKAYIPGDIAPDMPVIGSGSITIDGVARTIVKGQKNLNPDGTVNFTEVDVE